MMNDDKNQQQQNDTADNESLKNEKELPVQNPFDKNDNKKITQQDIDDEQAFKEAQTERD